MCGIIHLKRFDNLPARRVIEKRYAKQKSRGTQGYGFIAIENKKIQHLWRMEGEEMMLKKLHEMRTSEILLHHRNPSSTPNLWEMAHPIFVSHKSLRYDYYIVHNGVITNCDTLKETHELLGYKYNTEIVQEWKTSERRVEVLKKFNDSEAFAIELARDLDKGGMGIPSVSGSIAFIALCVEKGDAGITKKLFWGRNSGNPLRFSIDKVCMVIASEGDGKECDPHHLYSYDYDTGEIKDCKYTVGVTMYASNTKSWYEREKELDKKEQALDVIPPVSAIQSLLKTPIGFRKEEDDADLLDPRSGIPIITLEMSEGATVDALMDMANLSSSLEKEIDKGTHSGSYQCFLIERQAHVQVCLEEIRKKLRLPILGSKEEIDVLADEIIERMGRDDDKMRLSTV